MCQLNIYFVNLIVNLIFIFLIRKGYYKHCIKIIVLTYLGCINNKVYKNTYHNTKVRCLFTINRSCSSKKST